MSAEMVTALSGIGVSVATAAGSVWVARAGRRTARQERRDDFTAFSEQQGKTIERLERRIEAREAEAERQRVEIVEQRKHIAEQDEVIGWLWSWTRSLVSFVRELKHEPPAPPQPVPDAARRYTRTDV